MIEDHALLNLLQYWRNSLADTARVEIQVDRTIHLHDAVIDFIKGSVLQEQAIALLDATEKRDNENKGRFNKEDPDWEYLNETSILIALLRISPRPEYTKLSGETGVFYPYWLRAILNRNGILEPGEDSFPYIPRPHLEPQVNQNVNFIFSDVCKVDQAFAKPFAGNNTWQNYWAYIQEVFINITGMKTSEYAPENHVTTFSNTIVINDALMGAADGIIGLYDYLIREKETPTLLANLSQKSYTPLKPLLVIDDFEKASVDHLGQMAHKYSLSISQRKSLYHYIMLNKGDILAVNGPPGTGKTTLLQSIVANEVVKSAIKGEAPSIILACSSNNQAVANIITSFSHSKQKQGLLYERWLPELSGFGLYLPKQNQPVTKNIPDIKRVQGKLAGAHKNKENNAYLEIAGQKFTESFEARFELKGLTVKEIVSLLQEKLKDGQQRLLNGIKLWHQYKSIAALIQKLDSSFQQFEENELDEENIVKTEAVIKELELKTSTYLDEESFLMKLFAFLRSVKEKRATRLKHLFRDCPLSYLSVDFYKISSLHQFFDEKLKLIQQIKNYSRAWRQWKQANNVKANPPVTDSGLKRAEQNQEPFFYDELEMGLKYDLFHLAIHYWEGRWLMATKDALTEDRINKNGISHAKERWQRFAMLTPCFVSTFYMAPKFFTYSKFIKTGAIKNVWETPPLLDFIDILIVDEAGQVSPEIGAAAFALAKKSVVVGDTMQIEPVWNVPKKVDHANLHRHSLVTNINDHAVIDDLQTKGFLSSSGSIMKLAQKRPGKRGPFPAHAVYTNGRDV